MTLPISIQIMKQTRIENEKYYSKRDKAKKMFQPLQEKYLDYTIGTIPSEILTKEEKLLLYRCFRCYMDIDSSSLLAFSNTYTGYIIEKYTNTDLQALKQIH
jgi:pyoverdine/dityrosine biosynthesis protein Dit1